MAILSLTDDQLSMPIPLTQSNRYTNKCIVYCVGNFNAFFHLLYCDFVHLQLSFSKKSFVRERFVEINMEGKCSLIVKQKK